MLIFFKHMVMKLSIKLKRKEKLLLLIICLLLKLSLFAQNEKSVSTYIFDNANTRENYESIHNVKEAHKFASGKGIKIGIIGTYFGIKKHPDLYKEGKDFINDLSSLEKFDEHGYWMALTLKEIAPNVDIYALNARSRNDSIQTNGVVKSIEWAINNKIDILTYSGPKFKDEYNEIINEYLEKANKEGIVLTFIHNSNENNILPFGLLLYDNYYSRKPDVRILHYDYNFLLKGVYEKYLKADKNPKNGNEIPFFSFSSMSPVLAGAVAILMEINPDLKPNEYKQIIIKSSKEYYFEDTYYNNVLDISNAVFLLQKQKKVD